jgi:hypothetical protein
MPEYQVEGEVEVLTVSIHKTPRKLQGVSGVFLELTVKPDICAKTFARSLERCSE